MTSTLALPRPLLGDGNGRYKIAIVGNSGAGKSTVAIELSRLLGIPRLALDEVYWKPGWVHPAPEAFREKVKAFLDTHPDGWIVDGDYTKQMGTIAQDAATDILWLDPPLVLTFWRVVKRTFRRIYLEELPCAPGCLERVTVTLGSKHGIFWWCLSQHSVVRAEFAEKWENGSAEEGKGKWRRFGGWGSSLSNWLDWIRDSVRSE